MNNYEIIVKNAALHVLDTNAGSPVLSNKEIGSEQEGFDFIENLVRKMLADDNTKKACFAGASNKVQQLCDSLGRNHSDFLSLSQKLATWLYELMTVQPAIPSADLICSLVLIDGIQFLGLLKLNYRTNYIHHVEHEGEINVNLLVKQKTVLPGEHQKLEEAALINLSDLSIQLVEKEYEIDGKKDYYLSKQFLACSDQLSAVQKAKIISKAAEKLSKKYNNEKFDSVARLRKTVTETLDDNKAVAVASIAREIFHDDPGAQREYIEEIKQAGIREEQIQLSEKITERKFRNHRIKTDTGIEINFPSTYYNNKEMIEFINHPNGTVSIIIKNVGKISNK